LTQAKKIRIALAGNPNSGKTTIFNHLTGERQHVGNYAGVTVEKMEGDCEYNGQSITVVDLPGTYSLTAYSLDELVARNYILEEQPDVVVNIVDASNLERHLYLTTQLLEMNVPMVVALNMSDIARQRGYIFDLKLFSELLGVPVVPLVGSLGKGIDEMMGAIVEIATGKRECRKITVENDKDLDEEITRIEKLLVAEEAELCRNYSPRWLAVKLLENDREIGKLCSSERLFATIEKSQQHIQSHRGSSAEILIAESRYGFISGVATESVTSTVEARHDLSDRIDSILLNRGLGIPIFLLIMYGLFFLTFKIGEIPMTWLEGLFSWLKIFVSGLFSHSESSILKSLLVDGILSGVGGVLIFLPNIFLLFLSISLLEDSGYLARAAFLMDRLMHKIGLHGKSFIPLLTGFGCSVPAIMATRTLESKRDRIITILITPLMSCGARMPIYLMIIAAFFPSRYRTIILFSIYLIGVILAILSAIILGKTIFKGEAPPFVMELPPYRIPTIAGAWGHTWERAGEYLKKAGTIILGFSIIVWTINTYPKKQIFSQDYNKQITDAQNNYKQQLIKLLPQIKIPNKFSTALDTNSGNSVEVSKFIQCQKQYEQIQQNFCDKTKNLEKNSAEFTIFKNEKNQELQKLKDNNPQCYQLTSKYQQQILIPYQQQLAKIAHEKQREQFRYTIGGRIGNFITPIMKPLGFDWHISTSLIGAFAAKEMFVAQMGVAFSVGGGDENSTPLRSKLRNTYNPLQGFCIMLFCLISVPCISTIAVTRRETNSWGWAMFQLSGLTIMAYIITFCVYQLGTFLKIGIGA